MKIEKLVFLFFLSSLLFFTESCQPNLCGNGIQDGDETGIDCGGVNCPPCIISCNGSGFYSGDVILTSQAQVDSFGNFNYKKIKGTLNLSGATINSLSSLCSIKSIESLYLFDSNLTDLDGLHNLDSINGHVYIINNNSLINLDYLSNVSSSIQELNINYNQLLSDISGIANTTILGSSFSITNNNSLLNIPSFNLEGSLRQTNIELIGIQGNFNLDFLNNKDSIGSLFILDNPDITSLTGFNTINFIGYTDIKNNSSLTNFCVLSNLFSGSFYAGWTNTSGNAYNPTYQNMENGNCFL